MDRVEAEAIYDAGREAVVEVLLRMDAQIQTLTERVARQDERLDQPPDPCTTRRQTLFSPSAGAASGRSGIGSMSDTPSLSSLATSTRASCSFLRR